MAIAADVGLDVQRLRRDMENPAIEEYLDETIRLARTLGINGTPAFVIGDTLVPGAVDGARLKELIALARSGGYPQLVFNSMPWPLTGAFFGQGIVPTYFLPQFRANLSAPAGHW